MGRKKLLELSDVLKAIERSVQKRGVPPTVRELARDLGGLSTRTVHRYLQALDDESWIERRPGSRGIRQLRSSGMSAETVAVPLVGEVPAGPLLYAEENREGFIRLPRDFIRPSSQKHFLLRVRGDSMNKARVNGTRIDDKDLVLVRQQASAESGDIVVALIDGEATIKRFRKALGYVTLTPESSNPAHRPIIADARMRVQGVVRRVIRRGAQLVE